MAIVDYGALLRINGKFINKNKGLFMDMKDMCGFELDKAEYPGHEEINIDGNYFVYAGSPDLLIVFYKICFYIIRDGMIVKSYYGSNMNSEIVFVGDDRITISHLDNEYQIDKDEIDNDMKLLFTNMQWLRYVKRIGRNNRKGIYKDRTQRFLATWEHNGNKYEVIFGYGIDPNEEVWNEIKFESYSFTEKEQVLIDSWFKESD